VFTIVWETNPVVVVFGRSEKKDVLDYLCLDNSAAFSLDEACSSDSEPLNLC